MPDKMTYFAVLLAAVLMMFVQISPGAAGPTGFIHGGADAFPGQFKEMVMLKERVDGIIIKYDFVCGGVLIHPRLVLTAEHCVPREASTGGILSRDNYQVIVGKHHFSQPDNSEKDYFVKNIVKLHSVDIALLELKSAVEETDYIKRSRIATSLPSNGSAVTVIGWGETESGADPDVLQMANIFMKSISHCNDQRKLLDPHGIGWCPDAIAECDPHFCAGKESVWYEGACFGDSGGPLLYTRNGKREVVGLVYQGCNEADPPRRCNRRANYSHYVDVPDMCEWIKAAGEILGYTDIEGTDQCQPRRTCPSGF